MSHGTSRACRYAFDRTGPNSGRIAISQNVRSTFQRRGRRYCDFLPAYQILRKPCADGVRFAPTPPGRVSSKTAFLLVVAMIEGLFASLPSPDDDTI